MAKKTKEDILKMINEMEGENITTLMEDITDSWLEGSTVDNTQIESLQAEVNKYKTKSEDLEKKYRERFLQNTTNTNAQTPGQDDGMQEKNFIDIKEI